MSLSDKLCAATEHDDQQTGGVGIECAAMADFLDSKLAANRVHDIVRRRAGGFVNEDCAVERRKILA